MDFQINIVSHLGVVINKPCSRHKVPNNKITRSINKKRLAYEARNTARIRGEGGNAALRLRAARKSRAWKPKSRARFSARPLSSIFVEDETVPSISREADDGEENYHSAKKRQEIWLTLLTALQTLK